jgi:hypothetical protein
LNWAARWSGYEPLAAFAALTALLTLGLWLLARSRDRNESTSPSKGGFLDSIREAYDAGEIDEQEYIRIRDKLTARKATSVKAGATACDVNLTPDSAGEDSAQSADSAQTTQIPETTTPPEAT